MPAQVISNQDTGAKKVIGASGERGFMPNTLIEWLALLAILFIIFILGRSVYASYKEDDHAHKH
jgi:preprotein translocase subunit SecG